ncbi:uncharacterized protein DSM5745_03247 [Aspergillus mulundensis]|uniref:acetate--CoA ligase n=1 Tax=Aspergillus mulundensis TaxID=1810919 RepID=A0A3D8SJU2_9EURO|nr:hypothetical protein DSM5745_03247 [Aspergillus mulundensis]RDW86605.1 hypothetical protein DSM5745_03247 [Aspergillus mulundensis]
MASTIPLSPDWCLNHPSEPHLSSLAEYHALYAESIQSPSHFWAKLGTLEARQLLSFEQDFHTPHIGSLASGDSAWFLGGKLNASFNCVDRHAIANPDRIAIIAEPDHPADASRQVTYGELLRHVCQLAAFLRSRGVHKRDIVTIYMPMVPKAIYALLACDAKSTLVIIVDEAQRGGKSIPTKAIVDEAVSECPCVQTVLTYRRTGPEPESESSGTEPQAPAPWTSSRGFWWDEAVPKFPAYIPPEPMDSEDYLFLLYTSGSTGKPKGVFHSTAGYLVGAAVTAKYVLDIHRFFCAGDICWITGHTYVVYAPLLLGCTTVVFEGTPSHPTPTRYWEVLAKHAATHFYAAPTALRLLKRCVSKADIVGFQDGTRQLRVLGSVGEPIAPETWQWYFDSIGNARACITDVSPRQWIIPGILASNTHCPRQTYWQTETGSHLIAGLAGATPMKPGSAALPTLGIDPVLTLSTP